MTQPKNVSGGGRLRNSRQTQSWESIHVVAWEIRLGCECIPHQAAQSIWRCAGRGNIWGREKSSISVELGEITPYD